MNLNTFMNSRSFQPMVTLFIKTQDLYPRTRLPKPCVGSVAPKWLPTRRSPRPARAVLHAPAVLTYRRMCDLWLMDRPSHSTSWNGIAARTALPGEAAAPASRFQRARVVEGRNAFRMCRASPQSSRQHQGAPSHRRGRAAPRMRTCPAPLAACSH